MTYSNFQTYIDKYKVLIIYFISYPLVLNFVNNLINKNFVFGLQNSNQNLELINLAVGFLLFIFYYNFGIFLKSIFEFKFITTNIICFWITVFAIDNSLLFLTKNFSFKVYLLSMFILFVIIGLYKKARLKNMFIMFFTLICTHIFIDYISGISSNLILFQDEIFTSDERSLWYPATRNIFDNNYFYALNNNPFSGYGLMTSYISAINSVLLNLNSGFQYYLAINYIFIFLFFSFIYEISTSIKTFYNLSLIFLSIILTSSWFTYVFFGSLLSEVISSFCFGILFTEIFISKNLKSNNFLFLLFSFGYLYFTRQFISVLILIYIVFLAINSKKIIFLIGFLPLITKIVQSNYISSSTVDPYINSEWLGSIYFNYENITKTIKQFFIDKPISYLFVMFLFLSFFYIKKTIEVFDFYFIFGINLLFVFLLMTFLWNKSDVQSSYRYILNPFYLIIYPLANIMNSHFSSK